MDLTDTIIPKSDQLNAEDLLTGPRTFTVTDVRKGTGEQPVDIHLAEFPGRPFRPSKTVRRILVAAWGKEGDAYPGRRMTLYRDPDVRFGGQNVGGIRVSHLSHIDKPLTLALTETRGKRATHVVKPLPDVAPPAPASVTRAQLTALNAGLTALGYTDRPAIYAVLSRELNRPISSSSELTQAEASSLIERIQAGQLSPPAAAEPSDTFVEEPPADWQPEGGANQ